MNQQKNNLSQVNPPVIDLAKIRREMESEMKRTVFKIMSDPGYLRQMALNMKNLDNMAVKRVKKKDEKTGELF